MTDSTIYQSMLSNGQWVGLSEDRLNTLASRILEREKSYAPRMNREPMTTAAEVLAALGEGQELHYDDDWYAKIRKKPVPVNRAASVQTPKATCYSCGCELSTALAMAGSLGTLCPDCYDDVEGEL